MCTHLHTLHVSIYATSECSILIKGETWGSSQKTWRAVLFLMAINVIPHAHLTTAIRSQFYSVQTRTWCLRPDISHDHRIVFSIVFSSYIWVILLPLFLPSFLCCFFFVYFLHLSFLHSLTILLLTLFLISDTSFSSFLPFCLIFKWFLLFLFCLSSSVSNEYETSVFLRSSSSTLTLHWVYVLSQSNR